MGEPQTFSNGDKALIEQIAWSVADKLGDRLEERIDERIRQHQRDCQLIRLNDGVSRWKKWEDRGWRIAAAILAGLAIFLLTSCSAASQIASDVSVVRTLAQEIHTDAADIDALAENGSEIDSKAKNIQSNADAIQSRCVSVQKTLPKVEDRESWLDRLIRWGLPILGLGLLIGACIYFGVGKIIRPLMERLGRWISPTDQRDAVLDAKVVAGKMEIKEAIAARRASRPGYEAAREQLSAPSSTT